MRPKRWVNKNGVMFFQLLEGLYQVTFCLDLELSTVINEPDFHNLTAIDIIFIIEKDKGNV